MPKKTIVSILLLLLCPSIGCAYDLMGASGGGTNGTGYMVYHSVGEPVANSSQSTNFKLSAGFIRIVEAMAIGSTLDSDNDGLDDAWEMQYFGNLLQGPMDDPDGDQLTNLEEYELDLDPTDGVADSDGDSLADRWELDYFGALTHGRDDDPDNDRISNYIEFLLTYDPSDASSRPEPGLQYKYDALGRIQMKIRISN